MVSRYNDKDFKAIKADLVKLFNKTYKTTHKKSHVYGCVEIYDTISRYIIEIPHEGRVESVSHVL